MIRDRGRSSAGAEACLEAREARMFISLLRDSCSSWEQPLASLQPLPQEAVSHSSSSVIVQRSFLGSLWDLVHLDSKVFLLSMVKIVLIFK